MNKKCQVFTPEDVVVDILNYVGYKKNLYGKKILENSCGNGNFLVKIVERYIKDCKKNKMSDEDIKKGLYKDIVAFEIDSIKFNECITRLNYVVKGYNLDNVKWNITNKDALKQKFDCKFDYIVGNPPYVGFRDLDVENREFIKKNFETCKKGKPDYFYAFCEFSIKNLSDKGKLGYIIPNGILKNEYAEDLREFIKKYLKEIYDYKNDKVFGHKTLTYSAIIICQGNTRGRNINYINLEKGNKYVEKWNKNELALKWYFKNDFNNGENVFGDYFKVALSAATLYNAAFVLDNNKLVVKENNYFYDGIKLEDELIKRGASPKNLIREIDEYIIFPYLYTGNGCETIDEKIFEDKYKNIYNILLSHKIRLLERDSDKNAKWYEYGRSQGLQHFNTNKLVLSTLFSDRLKVFQLNEEYIPYSGLYITQIKDIDISVARRILESEQFYKYAQIVGKNANGNSGKLTSKDIANFRFVLNEFIEPY